MSDSATNYKRSIFSISSMVRENDSNVLRLVHKISLKYHNICGSNLLKNLRKFEEKIYSVCDGNWKRPHLFLSEVSTGQTSIYSKNWKPAVFLPKKYQKVEKFS